MIIKRTVVLGLLLAGCSWTVTAGEDKTAAAVAKFQGTWELVSRKIDGESVPAEKIKGYRHIVKGNSWTTKREGKLIHHGTFKIIEVQGKRIKLNLSFDSGLDKGKTFESLVEFQGENIFHSCRSLSGKGRPTELSAKKGSEHQVSTLKKIKP